MERSKIEEVFINHVNYYRYGQFDGGIVGWLHEDNFF
jgi:hypothetical protein